MGKMKKVSFTKTLHSSIKFDYKILQRGYLEKVE